MIKICKVEGCEKPQICRGFCKSHYNRFMKYGNPKKRCCGDFNEYEFIEEDKTYNFNLYNRKGEIVSKFTIDECDFNFVSKYRWSINDKYVSTNGYKSGESNRLHRLLLNLEYGDERQGDHINGNTLDNRRANLRIVTKNDNAKNRKVNSNNTSGRRGVYFEIRRGKPKWRISLSIDGKLKSFGDYDSIEEAILVREKVESNFYGNFLREKIKKDKKLMKFTDKEMLDWLEEKNKNSDYTNRVIFRKSGSGRGWRLHETSRETASSSVREAIQIAMNFEK